MALHKHDIPILEYDTEPKAVIMPDRKRLYAFPKKAVFPFLGDDIDRYAVEHGCEQIGEFVTITKTFPVYKAIHKGYEICLCQAPVGAPTAVMFLDFLIAYGCAEIISVGSCGALLKFPENEWLVPVEALRDDGVSYHYLPPKRTVVLNTKAVNAIVSTLEKQSIRYAVCKTWTTDGFYRETAAMVNHRKKENCAVVEMECAGLAACAEFRQIVFGQILYTADTLADVHAYDDRDWGAASCSLALKLALDAACEI